MRAVKKMLVEVKNPFVEETKGGIILLEKMETTQKAVQYGTVVGVPKQFKDKVDVGDILVFHFNIVVFSIGKQGEKIPSGYYLKDDIYSVPDDMVHLVIKPDGRMIMLGEWNLITPIEKEEEVTESGIIVALNNNKAENRKEEMKGVIECPNEYFGDSLKKGDIVVLGTFADYEVTLPDDRVMWMVYNRTILGKHD